MLAIKALVAIGAGLLFGQVNVALLLSGARRLGVTGDARSFAVSSLLRVGACGIVAVVFAAVGPWWTMALYIGALFVPFALCAVHGTQDIK